MIYAYALCPSPPEIPSLPQGIRASAVDVVTAGPVGAIVETAIDIAQIKEDDTQLMEAVLAHDRVLGHLFSHMPLLPLRFGTQFKDLSSVKTFLETNGTAYQHKLEILRDRAEYLIKLSPQPIELPEIQSSLRGRDYFLAKKQRIQAQSAALTQQAEEFTQFLAHLAATDVPFVHITPQDNEERLYALLSREMEQAQAAIALWQAQIPTWQITFSEPLPPYHFAD